MRAARIGSDLRRQAEKARGTGDALPSLKVAMLAIGEALLFRCFLVAPRRRDQRLAFRCPVLVEHFRQFGNPRGVGGIGVCEFDEVGVFADVRRRRALRCFVGSGLGRCAGHRCRGDLFRFGRLFFGTARQQQRADKDRDGVSPMWVGHHADITPGIDKISTAA